MGQLSITTPRPFQWEGIRAIYGFRGRALLADEQGLGKTLQALYWIAKIPRRRPVLIVTPTSVKYNWQAEAKKHFNMRTEVIEGLCPDEGIRLTDEIIIINYEILESWFLPLKRARFQVVILDECQWVSNPDAIRTRMSRKLARRAASVVALSGTPLTNRPNQLWSVLNIIRPDLFRSKTKYLWRYCKPKLTRWGWKFDGANHLGELHRILRAECMIRRLKKEVLHELPDKTYEVIPFRLKSYKEYNRAKNNFLAWLKEVAPSKVLKARRSEALVKVGYLLRLCAELKMEWTIRWLEDYALANPEGKLVALSMHTFVIERLHKRFPRSVVINGSVTGRRRDETVRAFQNNRKIQFLFGNWKAAGIGVTLTASHVLASLDFPWTPGDLSQGQDRVHRIGQTKKVIIYYLLLLHTIEEGQLKGLKKKMEILEAVLNGKRASNDFDLLESLIDSLD